MRPLLLVLLALLLSATSGRTSLHTDAPKEVLASREPAKRKQLLESSTQVQEPAGAQFQVREARAA